MAQNVLSVLKETGTNVNEDIKLVKFGGLPIIGGKLSADEKADILAWTHKVVENIK